MVHESECGKSSAYSFLGYKTAWLSYYYPVEWSVACLTLDSTDGNAKDKIVTTLNSCKKRNIKVLPPDINTSKASFTVSEKDGEKCIRFGFLAIPQVGEAISNYTNYLIKADGEFKSFEDFLARTVGKNNNTLRKIYTAFNGNAKKFSNPFAKTNVIALILAGTFDELEPNRYKLYNDFIIYRNKKDELKTLKDADNYKLKDKLALELEILGFYVSQHPLDGDVFPYVDFNLVSDNQFVKYTGILISYTKSKTKKGDAYYTLVLELRDGSTIKTNLFKATYEKYPESIKGLSKAVKEKKEIYIVKGKYSSKYNNVTANAISKVRSSSDIVEKEVPKLDDGITNLSVEQTTLDISNGASKIKDSLLDDELMTRVNN